MMRRLLAGVGLALPLLVSIAPPAHAACVAPTAGVDPSSGSDIVFEGVAQDGPNMNGILLSPAMFRVLRYFKGNGPSVVKVQTGLATDAAHPDTAISIEDEPEMRAGERWLIYAFTRADGVLDSACRPSRILAAGEQADPFPSRTLARTGVPNVPALVGGGAFLVLAGSGWIAICKLTGSRTKARPKTIR